MGDEMHVNSVVYTVGVIYLLPAPALQIPPSLGTGEGKENPAAVPVDMVVCRVSGGWASIPTTSLSCTQAV